jgi:hypothetical protein
LCETDFFEVLFDTFLKQYLHERLPPRLVNHCATMSGRFALAALFSAAAVANVYQTPLVSDFPTDLNEEWDDKCTISKSTAFEVYDGLNDFSTSPSEHIHSVKIKPGINSTNWEQWEFDVR